MKDSLKELLKILKQVMEETLSSSNVEVATITKDHGFHMFSKEELETLIKDISN